MGNGTRPVLLTVAAAVLAAEGAALLAYSVVNVIDIAAGHSSRGSNGLGLVLLQVVVIVFLALLALGVLRLQPWTRTPAVMMQVLIGAVALALLQARQYPWGALTLVLAVAALATLLAPASLKALARPGPADEGQGKGEARKSVSRRS
jgi:hypothetical protein